MLQNISLFISDEGAKAGVIQVRFFQANLILVDNTGVLPKK
jgi:hypothetical protein